MAKSTKLAHVVYSTTRFVEMIDWYKKVFEAQVVYRNSVLAFLTYDDEHHRFAIFNYSAFNAQANQFKCPAPLGVNHVGYSFATVGDLLKNYEHLKQLGITPYWSVHHGITLSFYYRDPDGNRTEFQVNSFPTASAAKAFMKTSVFAGNPIGVRIDPDKLLSRYNSGEPEEQLLALPDGPVSQIPPEHGL